MSISTVKLPPLAFSTLFFGKKVITCSPYLESWDYCSVSFNEKYTRILLHRRFVPWPQIIQSFIYILVNSEILVCTLGSNLIIFNMYYYSTCSSLGALRALSVACNTPHHGVLFFPLGAFPFFLLLQNVSSLLCIFPAPASRSASSPWSLGIYIYLLDSGIRNQD